ncbi:MAG: hypothetical protein KH230_07605 [Enterocloster asparagiformis]|nr:hypothetical protein [Enterocloster asparagiformis]
MKKSYLWQGIALLAVGLLCAVATVLVSGKLQSLISGFAGGGTGAGLVVLAKYWYWTRPQHAGRYQEKLEEEQICLKDERNEMFRDKAGRYTYILSLIVLAVSILMFSVLNALEIGKFRGTILYLSALLVFLYVAGIWIYRWLKAHN